MLEMFHWTHWEAAQAILKEGFRDGTGTYMTDHEHRGVWLTDTEDDPSQGAFGDTCLEVALDLAEEDIAGYEWIQESFGYREWLVPAELLNAKMKAEVHDRWVEPDWAK